MSVVEQSIREMELQEATLRARLLECRRGCSQGPEESSTEDAAGTSTSAGHLQGEPTKADPFSAAPPAHTNNHSCNCRSDKRCTLVQSGSTLWYRRHTPQNTDRLFLVACSNGRRASIIITGRHAWVECDMPIVSGDIGYPHIQVRLRLRMLDADIRAAG
ncbi:hypothetical protein TGME49_287450 [Toxoplasma gondii ME49]|uniref:Uncharacterized protein n=1 Tax=Toxoplasma gondii (strain ATCC 50611 / Me49) TaxID=508771 RepID=S8F8T4_TOXGM|nr:hypothetical protein TGME49_287450 [Toxoplasma gondii ME49]EPT31167.1 hypothetical protein TGME49_287450 [Toxoplasma gondii ME49]|eukprot:XP_018637853.1 hypothetical protein TGME49_287450 [Toxoplasma gondii ME49]